MYPRASQLAALCHGHFLAQGPYDHTLNHLLTDSRKLLFPKETVFFALPGRGRDGHSFLEELYQKGLRCFVVQQEVPSPGPEAWVCRVESSLGALQAMAQAHRAQFSYPLIAVTGSNGKTIVKEWASQLLAPDFRLVKSPSSYNSQIGVPLSVWQMDEHANLGLFEAGISRPGEMQRLQAILKPDWVILTNLGPAHDEGFTSREEKLSEKLSLASEAQVLIVRGDKGFVAEHRNLLEQEGRVLLAWACQRRQGSVFAYQLGGWELELELPFTDEASVENLGHCLVLMHRLGIPDEKIRQRVQQVKALPMRLELKAGLHGSYLVDDSYSNDLAGLELALDFLDQKLPPSLPRTLILSDLLETGVPAARLYPQVAERLKGKGIQHLIGIGEGISSQASVFGDFHPHFFPSTEAFLAQFRAQDWEKQGILVKGSRAFGFERIVDRLQQKAHGTVLEVSLEAVAKNLAWYRSQLSSSTKLMVMVKALAYGAGAFEIASLCQFHRVDYLAVAYPGEGVELREKGITLPIMVMNPSEEGFAKMVAYDLEPEVYSRQELVELGQYLQENKQKLKVHIEIDTGMHRLGFAADEVGALVELLRQYQDHLEPVSIFTHLAGADEDQHEAFSREQLATFFHLAQQVEQALGKSLLKHGLNSPGIVRFPEYHGDMVRLGIGLYGVEVNAWHQDQLVPVARLKTRISQIRTIEAGETVGYGRHGKALQRTEVAVVALGYGDGYPRAMSRGVGKMAVRGHLAPVLGNVCMDMTMLDVTGLGAEVGDEVEVFGERPTISQVAEWQGTIPYEVLTQVSSRVKRIFVG